MSEKSYVSLEQKVCPVCGKKHDVGVLLDKRLRKTLERHTVTGWDLCPECQQKADDGYIAMVECMPPADGSAPTLETAERTGILVHIRRHVFSQIFGEAAPADKCMVFVDPDVVTYLQKLTGEGGNA